LEEVLEKKAKIIDEPKPAGDVDITYADIEKAKRILGFSPKTGLREGLTKFVTWFKEHIKK
jgi:UDP-glucuronate 4-epimerase